MLTSMYTKLIIIHSNYFNGFRPTSLNSGVKISFCPDAIKALAAVSSTEWTFVDPLGAILKHSRSEMIP